MPVCSGTSLKIVEYFSWLARAGTPRSSWYMCRQKRRERAYIGRPCVSARAYTRLSKNRKGLVLERERESKERETRGKEAWRGIIRQTPVLITEKHRSLDRDNESFISYYSYESSPGSQCGSDRSPAKSNNSGRFNNKRRCHRICFQLRVVA